MSGEENIEGTQDLASEEGTPANDGDTAAGTADDREELLERIRVLEAKARGKDDKARNAQQAKDRRARETAAKSDDLSQRLSAFEADNEELRARNTELETSVKATTDSARRTALATAIAKRAKSENVAGIERMLRTVDPAADGFDPVPEYPDTATILQATKLLKDTLPALLSPSEPKTTPRPAPPRRPGLTPHPVPGDDVVKDAQWAGDLARRIAGPSPQLTAYEEATGRHRAKE